MPKSAGYVSPQYLKMVGAAVKSLKETTYKLMNIEPGDRVLDIGCGPGIDTIAMAPLVGEQGKVYGLDMDEEMIAIADHDAEIAHVNNLVEHMFGTASDMPFENDFFDAVRAERLFQVIPAEIDRISLFKEIHRVMKPGAAVVLCDTDWATASVDFPDAELERKLMSFLALRLRPDGFAGRSFRRYLTKAGFGSITVSSTPVVHAKLEETVFGEWLTAPAVKEGILTQAQADTWTAQLQKQNEAASFFASVNAVTVLAVKKAL